jgi:hypothetical protein
MAPDTLMCSLHEKAMRLTMYVALILLRQVQRRNAWILLKPSTFGVNSETMAVLSEWILFSCVTGKPRQIDAEEYVG